MRAPTDFLSILAFLEMLREGGAGPSPVAPSVPPMPPPPSPAQPAIFVPPVGPVVPPGTLPPMPPWQGAIIPCPATLPSFPGPGWVPDTPPSSAVVAEAQRWNPILWDYPSKTIVHASVCEQFGGRWMTFAAAWHPGDSGPQTYMATEAWRLASDQPMPAPIIPAVVPVPPPPAPPPMPHVIPPPGVIPIPAVVPPPYVPPPAPIPPPPVPTVVQTPLQHAAVIMAQALNTHGYKLADQPIYKQFQSAAGLGADGFPGTGTMGKLRTVLAQTVPPTPMPSVPIYPWKSRPGTSGYDGVNAPTWAQWSGQAPPAPAPVVPAVTPATGPPAPVEPYPGPGAYMNNAAYIARYQSALSYLSSMNPAYDPQGVDGKYGPHTIAAVKAFQADHGLTQDGQAGAATAAALDAAMGVSAAA